MPHRCLFLFSLLLFLAACSDNGTSPGNTPFVPPPTHPISPTGNNLILSQKTLGTSGLQTSIWDLVDDGQAGFFFVGLYNSAHTTGRLDRNGGLLWDDSGMDIVWDIVRVPVSPVGLNSLLLVGANDNDSDGSPDVAVALLYNSTGSAIAQLTYSEPSGPLWFKSVAQISESPSRVGFVAIGSASISSFEEPFVATFDLLADSTLAKGNQRVFSTLPGMSFSEVVGEHVLPSSAFYVVGNRKENAVTFRNPTVLKLTDALRIDWARDITVAGGTRPRGREIRLDSDSLYIVGDVGVDKMGTLRAAGLAASVSTDGVVNWTSVANLSDYDDQYIDCAVVEDLLVAVGDFAEFHDGTVDRLFGYGLVSVIDKATGEILVSHSIGANTVDSGFNSFVMMGGRAFCGGATNQSSASIFQGWFAELDVSGVFPAP